MKRNYKRMIENIELIATLANIVLGCAGVVIFARQSNWVGFVVALFFLVYYTKELIEPSYTIRDDE